MLNFVRLREDHLKLVLRWRIQPEVTRFMYTDIENSLEKQKEWFRSISSNKSCRHWIIQVDSVPVGLIHLEKIDLVNRRSSWGYYIGDADYRHLGGLIPPYFYTYCFSKLGLNKLVAEVMEGNENIIRLHKLHKSRPVGILKDHIFKYDRFHDIHLFELHAADWELFRNSPKKYVAEFED